MLAETRQSQSETSVLEDKAEAGFNLCSIDVTKMGPEKSKVGDDATYTIKITNTGAVTLFKQSIIDNVIGNLTADTDCGVSLAPGASCTITTDYEVQADDPDPLVNTVSVIYNRTSNLVGSQVTDSASHSTNLFQPAVKVTKGGDALSKVGDQVNYTFEVENTGSSDSPNLLLDTISDNVLGDLADDAPAACDSLAPGAKCNFNVNYTIQAGDADPLVNTVTVHYHPSGFPNDITATDKHSTNLFQPAVKVTKGGDALSKVGDQVNYTFEVENTGSSDSPNLLLDTISDNVLGDLADDAPAACDSLAPGAKCNFNVNYTIQAGDADPLVNTVTVHYSPAGFPNDHQRHRHAQHQPLPAGPELTKTGDALSKVGDKVNYTIKVVQHELGRRTRPDLKDTRHRQQARGRQRRLRRLARLRRLDKVHQLHPTSCPGRRPGPARQHRHRPLPPGRFPNDISGTDTARAPTSSSRP